MSKTALIDAIGSLDLDRVRAILEKKPALKDFQSEKGFNLLQMCCARSTADDAAAANRQLRLAKWLVSEGFDPQVTHTTKPGEDGEADPATLSLVFFSIARAQNTKLARFFLDLGVKAEGFFAAAWWGNWEILGDLVKHGADINEIVGATPFHMAVAVLDRGIEGKPERARRRVKTLKEFLRLGANPAMGEFRGETPLHTALKKEYDDRDPQAAAEVRRESRRRWQGRTHGARDCVAQAGQEVLRGARDNEMKTSRRDALKHLGAASAGWLLAPSVIRGRSVDLMVAGQPVEIAVSSVSDITVRITVRPLQASGAIAVPDTGALVQDEFGAPIARGREAAALARLRAGSLIVRVTESPPTIHIDTPAGQPLQRLTLDAAAPGLSFLLGAGPLLGLGEGGAQFDRRGSTDQMLNGQRNSDADGYRLAIHGTRAPIQWLVGTDPGWGLFIHQPYGAFDFTGAEGRFLAAGRHRASARRVRRRARDPKTIMREYARITGLPEMPARWTFGYLQSQPHARRPGGDPRRRADVPREEAAVRRR